MPPGAGWSSVNRNSSGKALTSLPSPVKGLADPLFPLTDTQGSFSGMYLLNKVAVGALSLDLYPWETHIHVHTYEKLSFLQVRS